MITRGFKGRRPRGDPSRVPPGQYVTDDFPVLSAGPTPRTPLDDWSFALRDVDEGELATWSWKDQAFPARDRALERHGESDGTVGGAAPSGGVPLRRR